MSYKLMILVLDDCLNYNHKYVFLSLIWFFGFGLNIQFRNLLPVQNVIDLFDIGFIIGLNHNFMIYAE